MNIETVVISFMALEEQHANELLNVLEFSATAQNSNTVVARGIMPDTKMFMLDGKEVPTLVFLGQIKITGNIFSILWNVEYIKQHQLPTVSSSVANLMFESLTVQVNSEVLGSESSVSWLLYRDQQTQIQLNKLQDQVDILVANSAKQEKKINFITNQYEALQVYIRNYVDIEKMKEILLKLANIIDEEILSGFTIIRKH